MAIQRHCLTTAGSLRLLCMLCTLTAVMAAPKHALAAPQSGCISTQALLQSKKAAVLYLWSPRMVGAVLEARHAQQAAINSGARFVAALDPRVSISEAQAALKRSSSVHAALLPLHQACAESLPDQALDHAPSMLVFAAHQQHRHRILGVMPQAAWQAAIALRLAELAH